MIITFGYRNGPPPPAHLVYDCRDLPNPHHDKLLRDLNGNDPLVIEWVTSHGGEKRAREIVSAIRNSAQDPIRIAIGCSGGKHRSVVIARLVATLTGEVIEHRDFSPA